MGYFDWDFKKSATGETLFYPWGVLGTGYVLRTQAQQDRIRKFLKRYYAVAFSTLGLVQFTVGVKGSLALLAILYVWYRSSIKQALEGAPASGERLTLADRAQSMDLGRLLVAEIASLAFVAAGIWVLSRGAPLLMALFSIGFFGLASVVFAVMILKKIRG